MQPVIIAGAGPTGLALALALARQGVPSLLLDGGEPGITARPARTCVLPPDVAHWARLPGAREHALAWRGWRAAYRGRPADRQAFPAAAAPWHLAQHALQEALRRAVTASELVERAAGVRLGGLEQDEYGVTARLTGHGGERRGSHLVGCDGARSTVRKLLGIAFPGPPAATRYAVAAVRASLPWPDEASLDRALPGPGGAETTEVTARPLPDGVWRLDWPLPADEGLVTPEALLERLHRALAGWHGGRPPPFELLDTGVHTCHRRLARRWRSGRAFLAGDAAHLLGALGTQQVAEGLRDADNLAWKLAAARRHEAPGALLDGYEAERRAAVGRRLRAVDQALPLVLGRGGRLTGRGRNRLTLLGDVALGRGALGAAPVYDLPRPKEAVVVETPLGAPVADIPVTALDGTTSLLRERLGGPLLLVLTAPGARVWDARHWLAAGLMPDLAEVARTLPLPAELLVAEEYPGAPAHTLLLVRPDGHLAAALPGGDQRGLEHCAAWLYGTASGAEGRRAG